MSSVASQTPGIRRELVTLKGSRSGLTVWLDAEAPFPAVRQVLAEKLSRARGFFAGARMAVAFAGRALTPAELEELAGLVEELGLVVQPPQAATGGAAPEAPPRGQAGRSSEATLLSPDGALAYGPIRSGTRLVSEGHLTVLGDVNPGAEVIAAGHIVVMGQLRGVAHAGARGDRRATVTALGLFPTQLRIADVVARSEDCARPSRVPEPEIAYIHPEEGRITVEPLRGAPSGLLRQAPTQHGP